MKTKMIFAITILLATASSVALAHEGEEEDDDLIAAQELILEKSFEASARAQALHVKIERGTHNADRPFVVEVNEFCPVASSTQNEERALDTVTACDIATNTLEFDSSTSELSLLIRQPDEEGTCSPKAKKIVMQLQSICDER